MRWWFNSIYPNLQRYSLLAAYEKEIADHNESVLKSLGKKAQKDFEELLDCCNVTEKIEFVDAPNENIF